MAQYEYDNNLYEVVEIYRIDNPRVKQNFLNKQQEFFNSGKQNISSKAELTVRARNHFREYFYRTSVTGKKIKEKDLYEYICKGVYPNSPIPVNVQFFIRKMLKPYCFVNTILLSQLKELVHEHFPSLIQHLPDDIDQIGYRTLTIDQCLELFSCGVRNDNEALMEELKKMGLEEETKSNKKSCISWQRLTENLADDIEKNPNTLLTFLNNQPSDAHEIRWAWHGTPSENISTIASDNFNPAYMKRQVHGTGFYFSPNPYTAIAYAKPKKVNRTNRHALLLCQILLGHSQPSRKKDGDSNTHKDYCYAIANINQINPCYVVVVQFRDVYTRRKYRRKR